MAVVVTSPVTAVISTADSLADGSAGAPSVAFSTDATTGFCKSAAKTVGVSCNGALSLEVSDVAINCHNKPLTNVGDITCKSTGQAITNLNAATGITAGMDVTAVKSLAGIAGGAPITNAASLAMIAAGGGITNCTSVASTAADMTLKANAHIIAQLSDTIADGAVGLLLRRNVGGVFTLEQVTMGASDSGGSGYKVLRVPN